LVFIQKVSILKMINWFKKSEEWFDKHPVISGVIEFTWLVGVFSMALFALVVFS